MSGIVRALVGLYPRSFREQWGPDIEFEAQAAGRRCWPGLVIGALDMWLHPTVWPARSAVQRRSRAAAMAVSATIGVWFLVYAATELDDPLNHWASGTPVLACCAAVIALGLALVSPLPKPTPAAVLMVLDRAVRQLTVPAILAGLVVFAAQDSIVDVGNSSLRWAVVGAWWFTLALGGIGACRVFTGLDPDLVRPPSENRLRVGLAALLGAGALAASSLLRLSLTSRGIDLPAAVTGAGLVLVSAAFSTTLHDLRQLPGQGTSAPGR